MYCVVVSILISRTVISIRSFTVHATSQTALGDLTGADENGPDLCHHMPLKNIGYLHSFSVIFHMASTAGRQNVADLWLPAHLFVFILLPGVVPSPDLESAGWSLTLAHCLSTVSNHPLAMDWLHHPSTSPSPHWFWSFYTWTQSLIWLWLRLGPVH